MTHSGEAERARLREADEGRAPWRAWGTYDVLSTADGQQIPLRVQSLVGLLPLCATTTLGLATLERLPSFAEHFQDSSGFRGPICGLCAVP